MRVQDPAAELVNSRERLRFAKLNGELLCWGLELDQFHRILSMNLEK